MGSLWYWLSGDWYNDLGFNALAQEVVTASFPLLPFTYLYCHTTIRANIPFWALLCAGGSGFSRFGSSFTARCGSFVLASVLNRYDMNCLVPTMPWPLVDDHQREVIQHNAARLVQDNFDAFARQHVAEGNARHLPEVFGNPCGAAAA